MSVVLRVGPMGPVYNRPPKLRPGARVVKVVEAPVAAKEMMIDQISKPVATAGPEAPKPTPSSKPIVSPIEEKADGK